MASHVVFDTTAPRDVMRLLCLSCGGALAIKLPVSVDEMTGATEGFGARHRDCAADEKAKTRTRRHDQRTVGH